MPAKPDITPGRDEPDYINVRVPGGATSLMTATRGDRVRVHGFLQSRDFKESLTEFLGKARKNGETPDIEKLLILGNMQYKWHYLACIGHNRMKTGFFYPIIYPELRNTILLRVKNGSI